MAGMLSVVVIACSEGNETPAVGIAPATAVASVSEIPTESPFDVEPVVTPAQIGTESVESTQVQQATQSGRGILRYEMEGGALIPDPAVDEIQNRFLFGEVYSGLTRLSADEGRIEPDLASTISVGDDGLEYRFVLKKDLKFSDGSPVTAADVKWSWERALKLETQSDHARDVLGMIVGSDAVISGAKTELQGVEVIDDLTLVVRLVRPAYHFTALLSDPVASVLKPDNVKHWGVDWLRVFNTSWVEGEAPFQFKELPASTGPFKLAEFDFLKNVTVLKPNENYWDVGAQLEALEYTNLYSSYWHGEAPNPSLDPNQFDVRSSDSFEVGGLLEGAEFAVNSVPVTGKGVASDTAPQSTFLAFNTAISPYDDVDFRRALVAAADASDLDVRYLVGFPDTPASALLPPQFPGHETAVAAPLLDRNRAEDAFAASRYADSAETLTMTFLTERIELGEEDFARMTDNWGDWLRLNPRYGTETVHGNAQEMSDAFQSALADGTLEMRFVRIRPGYPDPHAILGIIPVLFGEKGESPETQELEAMLQAAAAEPDAATRLERYQDIERHILDRALVLPLFWDSGGAYHVVRDWVHGFKVPKYGGSMFKNVWIDVADPAYPSNRSVD